MKALNYPKYPFSFQKSENKLKIFDRVRKKFVALTPEEWVRQHVVWYLIEERNVPEGLIKLERSFKVNNRSVRSDITVFDNKGNPLLMVECKSANIQIDNKTLFQIGRYNIETRTKWLMLTNGIENIFCEIDFETKKINFVNKLPNYNEL